jgi:lantibiotic modifying enzyme
MESSRLLQPEYQPGDHHVLPPWEALLDEPLRSQAQQAALHTASRMRDPEHVQRIAQQAREQSPDASSWDLSLPTACADLALFYSFVARCFPEQDWQTTAQRYLKLVAVRSQQHAIASPALFGGTSGVAFVVHQCSGAGQRSQQTLAHLHQAIAEQVRQHSSWQLPPEGGVAESDFDLISGASGIVGYLASVPTPDRAVHEALHTLLDYLLALTKPGQILGQERWWCPPSRLVTEQDRQRYPCGRFNCGLAHGLPGILAALALAALAGYGSPGLQEALSFVGEWLIHHQIHDEWGITWPVVIPHEHASSPERWRTLPPSRTAWCYGAPGSARSLWLAGRALREDRYASVALEALHTVLKRPRSMRRIDAPNLCHGMAGLLLICLRFAHESGDPLILEHIPRLVEQILTQFDPQSPLGFRDIGPGGILVDQAGFLTGAPGVALALLAAASPVAPSWDRLLLLS